jgi:nucleoside-diphosphate-sugar epimerase
MVQHSKVLLTGASGFIAAHILDILVKRGYQVVATVRSSEKEQFIREKYPGKETQIQVFLVPDIQDDHAFDNAFLKNPDISAVIHTASPFFQAKDDPENELLLPAIKGTTNILNAIKRHAPKVRHVVITSSFAALLDPTKQRNHDAVFSEATWNPITYDGGIADKAQSYRASKKLAEKAFWDFIEKEKLFTGTTINPPSVFGPLIHKVNGPNAINTSSDIIYTALRGEKPYPDTAVYNLWVDVRDVALAHVLAIEKDEAVGKRWFLAQSFFHPQTVLDSINKSFPQLKGKISVGTPYSQAKIEQDLLTYHRFENSKTSAESGIEYIDFDTSIKDAVETFLKLEAQWSK